MLNSLPPRPSYLVPVSLAHSRRSQPAARKPPLPAGGESRRSQPAARKSPFPVGGKKAPSRRYRPGRVLEEPTAVPTHRSSSIGSVSEHR